jgi:hypothetical protein
MQHRRSIDAIVNGALLPAERTGGRYTRFKISIWGGGRTQNHPPLGLALSLLAVDGMHAARDVNCATQVQHNRFVRSSGKF